MLSSPLEDCQSKIAAPLGRLLRHLDKAEATSELLHHLEKIKDSQIVTKDSE